MWFQSLAMKKTWYTEAYIWLLESVARSCPIKKMFLTQVFSSEFAKFLRTPFFIQQFSFIEHLRCLLLVVNYFQKNFQKQPSRGVHKKRCYENMQQIYRRTPMPKKKATFMHLIKALNSWQSFRYLLSILKFSIHFKSLSFFSAFFSFSDIDY